MLSDLSRTRGRHQAGGCHAFLGLVRCHQGGRHAAVLPAGGPGRGAGVPLAPASRSGVGRP
jgi:hypothetical protein